jgi:predicted RNA-binding protein Jag
MKTQSGPDQQTLYQCTVVSIDDSTMAVKAFYNPSKIKMNKEVPWAGHSTAHGHAQVLEFTGAKNQTLSVDLFFDRYEAREDVSTYISTLVEMTEATIQVSAEEKALRSQVNNNSKDSKAHRPHFVMLVWGDMPAFKSHRW